MALASPMSGTPTSATLTAQCAPSHTLTSAPATAKKRDAGAEDLSAFRFDNLRPQGVCLVSDAVGLFGLRHFQDAFRTVGDNLIEAVQGLGRRKRPGPMGGH
jgi:hypothetical protein